MPHLQPRNFQPWSRLKPQTSQEYIDDYARHNPIYAIYRPDLSTHPFLKADISVEQNCRRLKEAVEQEKVHAGVDWEDHPWGVKHFNSENPWPFNIPPLHRQIATWTHTGNERPSKDGCLTCRQSGPNRHGGRCKEGPVVGGRCLKCQGKKKIEQYLTSIGAENPKASGNQRTCYWPEPQYFIDDYTAAQNFDPGNPGRKNGKLGARFIPVNTKEGKAKRRPITESSRTEEEATVAAVKTQRERELEPATGLQETSPARSTNGSLGLGTPATPDRTIRMSQHTGMSGLFDEVNLDKVSGPGFGASDDELVVNTNFGGNIQYSPIIGTARLDFLGSNEPPEFSTSGDCPAGSTFSDRLQQTHAHHPPKIRRLSLQDVEAITQPTLKRLRYDAAKNVADLLPVTVQSIQPRTAAAVPHVRLLEQMAEQSNEPYQGVIDPDGLSLDVSETSWAPAPIHAQASQNIGNIGNASQPRANNLLLQSAIDDMFGSNQQSRRVHGGTGIQRGERMNQQVKHLERLAVLLDFRTRLADTWGELLSRAGINENSPVSTWPRYVRDQIKQALNEAVERVNGEVPHDNLQGRDMEHVNHEDNDFDLAEEPDLRRGTGRRR